LNCSTCTVLEECECGYKFKYRRLGRGRQKLLGLVDDTLTKSGPESTRVLYKA
jgi:hypothetical protein